MMTGKISNHNYRLMLEAIKKEMERRKVKPVTPTENGGCGGTNKKK